MSTLLISERGKRTPASPIRKLAPLAEQAKKAGVTVYHLNIGQPDIASPREFFEGIQRYHESVVAYEPSKGNTALCESWSRYMNETLTLATSPDDFVITSGASEAILFALMAICDPGDEVIVFDPSYANYLGFAAMAGVTIVGIPTRIEDRFAMPDAARIRSSLSKRTKALLVCSPNNPTGTLVSREEMQMLLSLCNEHGLFLIADETYREFVYEGVKPLSFLHIDPNNPAIVVTDSLSKRFSLCGARIGAIITKHEEVRAAVARMASARLAVASIEQVAAAHLLRTVSRSFLAEVTAEYQKRRDTVMAGLQAIPGARLAQPLGAFYTIAELPVHDGEAFASFMLREFRSNNETVFVAPGAGFHVSPEAGKNQIRIAYVLHCEALQRAIQLLAEGVEAFRKRALV